MLHFGDITKISGFNVPIVDVVVGGSPCQDLSIAGKRAGLDGERSGLFMEQLRIIKEMREKDARDGRATIDVRPRYMVWENVPGAFSSHKGEDFRIVLEETAKVADKDAYVPMPDKGKWQNAGCVMGDGWSIAWRILDAQYWGTSSKPLPQRRRRIALVADFGGQSAPEILFVRKSVSGDIEPGEPPRKETSGNATRGVGADDIFCIDGDKLNKKERKGGSGLGIRSGDAQYTLTAKDVHGVAYGFPLGFRPENVRVYEEMGTTLCNGTRPGFTTGVIQPVVFENHSQDSRYKELGDICETVSAKYGTGGNNQPLVVECFSKSRRAQSATDFETWKESDTANTLNAFDVGDVRTNECVVALDRASYNQGKNAQFDIGIDEKGIAQSLVAKGPGAVCYSSNHGSFHTLFEEGICATLQATDYKDPPTATYIKGTRYIVRRLTPMECERLQGYPDGWTDIGEYTDTNGKKRKSSDAARYKALGNSIALPPWKWVMKRISACYERDATLASLFDGIGGFPYIWEQINGKGSCLWASEIEEFCIAVTKARIG